MFQNWIKTFSESNPKYLQEDWLSAEFADSLSTDLGNFYQRGVQKVTRIIPNKKNDEYEPTDPDYQGTLTRPAYVKDANTGAIYSIRKGFSFADGKNETAMYVISFHGEVSLIGPNGKKLRNSKPGANTIFLTFVKSAQKKHTTKQKCKSCLYEIKQHSDRFICEYCGSVYNINDYDWNLAYAAMEESYRGKSLRTLPLTILFLGSLVATCWPSLYISLAGILVAGLGIFPAYYRRLEKIKRQLKELKNKDPLFSIDGLMQRADAILHKVKDARTKQSFENVQKYVTPELFSNIQNAELSGMADPAAYYTYGTAGINSFRVDKGYEYAELEVRLRLFNLETRKRTTRNEVIELRRKAGVKTETAVGVTDIDCPNCNASIDIGSVSFCEYCGTEIQIENHDWVLSATRKGKNSILWG